MDAGTGGAPLGVGVSELGGKGRWLDGGGMPPGTGGGTLVPFGKGATVWIPSGSSSVSVISSGSSPSRGICL